MDTSDIPQGSADPAGEHLEQVREILFGAQSRGFDLKLATLEADMVRRLTELREEMTHRLEDLRCTLRSDVDGLHERIRVESEERRRADEDLASALARAAEALRNEKADRTVVAGLLRDLASKLTVGLPDGTGDGSAS